MRCWLLMVAACATLVAAGSSTQAAEEGRWLLSRNPLRFGYTTPSDPSAYRALIATCYPDKSAAVVMVSMPPNEGAGGRRTVRLRSAEGEAVITGTPSPDAPDTLFFEVPITHGLFRVLMASPLTLDWQNQVAVLPGAEARETVEIFVAECQPAF